MRRILERMDIMLEFGEPNDNGTQDVGDLHHGNGKPNGVATGPSAMLPPSRAPLQGDEDSDWSDFEDNEAADEAEARELSRRVKESARQATVRRALIAGTLKKWGQVIRSAESTEEVYDSQAQQNPNKADRSVSHPVNTNASLVSKPPPAHPDARDKEMLDGQDSDFVEDVPTYDLLRINQPIRPHALKPGFAQSAWQQAVPESLSESQQSRIQPFSRLQQPGQVEQQMQRPSGISSQWWLKPGQLQEKGLRERPALSTVDSQQPSRTIYQSPSHEVAPRALSKQLTTYSSHNPTAQPAPSRSSLPLRPAADFKPAPRDGVTELSRVAEEDEYEEEEQELQEGQEVVTTRPTLPPRKNALVSAMDKWRRVVDKRQRQKEDDQRAVLDQPPSVHDHAYDELSLRNPLQVQLSPPVNRRSTTLPLSHAPQPPSRHQTIAQPPEQDGKIQVTTPQRPQNQLSEDDRMSAIAVRARQIFIGSKYFNLWADKTARRLEREAVARRHMVRFRCFQGWSKAATLMMPIAEQLRKATAVQKLRRAVREQDRQLREIATGMAQKRELIMINQALDRWAMHRQDDLARQSIARTNRVKVAAKWLTTASDHNALEKALLGVKQSAEGSRALQRWQVAAEKGAKRSQAAQRIGTERLGLSYMREWWNQAEAVRRAKKYRQVSLTEQANIAFHVWNLRCRAEAFIWRNEYQAVMSAVEKWSSQARAADGMNQAAIKVSRLHAAEKFMDRLQQRNTEWAVLANMHYRASYYIGTTKAIDAMRKVSEAREKHRRLVDGAALKQRLHEHIAKTNRQLFYKALDRWHHQAKASIDLQQQAAGLRLERSQDQWRSVWARWKSHVQELQSRQRLAQAQQARPWVAKWRAAAEEHEAQDMQAWSLWAISKQKEYLRGWVIHSLHQGGQAHTAAMVKGQHERDKRAKVLQKWREGAGLRLAGEQDTRANLFEVGRSLYSSRAMSRRKSRRPSNPMETPSRTTGGRGAMDSTLFNRKPRASTGGLLGNDELGSAPPTANSSPSRPRRHFQVSTHLDTTTPRGPIPDYLQRGYQLRLQATASKPSRLQRQVSPPVSALAMETPYHTPYTAPPRQARTPLPESKTPVTELFPSIQKNASVPPNAGSEARPRAANTMAESLRQENRSPTYDRLRAR